MTHSEIQDLLEGYVDETLDRSSRRTVDEHLEHCAECRAILDDVAPVDLGGLGGGAVDERGLRRAVRKAIRRTVFDAALVFVAGWIVLWFVAAVVLQPLVVNRDNRAGIAAHATLDLAIMFNPGAMVTDIQIDSSWLHRTVTVDVGIPVGAATEDVGTIESEIGVFDAGGADGGRLWPFVSIESSSVDPAALEGLGGSTVATVSLIFPDGISVADAQELADDTARDVRVVWAGFPISDEPLYDTPFNPGGFVGYGTCGVLDMDPDFLSATSAGGSFGSIGQAPSIQRALDEVRRAVANLADSPLSFDEAGGGSVDQIRAAGDYLAQPDPGVVALVVTGPSTELAGFVEDAGAENAELLAVDFYNWTSPVCGR